MRVLIINTSENIGGAAIAANRLMEALKNNGVKAKMLVRDKRTDQITVASLAPVSPDESQIRMGTRLYLESQPVQEAQPISSGPGQHRYGRHLYRNSKKPMSSTCIG